MTIERSNQRISASRLAEVAQRLLDASTLLALATVRQDRTAYVNTAYFAWSETLELVWISHPDALHSRNIRTNATAAVAVYDSTQSWGRPDRGIQLFGTALEVDEATVAFARALYANRFPDYRPEDVPAYRLYAFRPQRVKLFDERELGAGRFVSAVVNGNGRLKWEATEVYPS